nr:hypothetical protein BaRGS_020788 [Batillaria attramentaria]
MSRTSHLYAGLNLDGGAVPPSEALSGKAAKKKKKAKKSETSGPPEVLDKFEPVPTQAPSAAKADWFHTSWKRSATYGMSKVFVEDEPLYKACASDVVVQRSWRETFLTLGPFGYMGRSKNPCWYPKDAKFTCIPHFFLAGAAGPGTADVMRKIMIHPYVLGHAEQIYWWDLGRHEGKTWDWYRENFQKEIDQILLDINDHKSSSKVFGDGTNTYFAAPTGWERLSGNENCQEPRITLASHIRRLRVKGLVIVVLPHPTRRMLAEFRMLSKGKVNPSQFHQYLVQAVKTYKDCFAKYSLRQCAYNKTVADSVKLAIAANPNTKEFRELVRNHNAGSFLPESIKMLNEFYEPFLKVLGEVMEDPKFTFKDT